MRNHLRIIAALLILGFCFSLAPAALAVDIPASAEAFFADRIAQGYEILAWNSDEYYAHAYAVLSKDFANKLLVLKWDGGGYKSEIVSSTAIYQGDWIPMLVSYNDRAFDVVYYAGVDTSEIYGYYRDDDGVWRLHEYILFQEDGGRRVFSTLYDDRMVYKYYPSAGSEATVVRNIYGVYQRALRYLNIRTLPRTLEEARETLSLPPQIPAGDFDAVSVKFTSGEKYEVYSAPDEYSLRAANGKAMVSTNDWIQVFGTEAGWALIQYDISSDKMRIGYITQTALPGKTSVPELGFIPQEIEVLYDTAVTDDPLNSQAQFTVLRAGQADCWYLATLNEDYVYIQATTDGGQLYRGFVDIHTVRLVTPDDEKE